MTAFTIIEPDGTEEKRDTLGVSDLRSILDPLFPDGWEHVTVFHEGAYTDMFVGEESTFSEPENGRATAVYWNNVKVHDPASFNPSTAPMIHGRAVLFAERVWR